MAVKKTENKYGIIYLLAAICAVNLLILFFFSHYIVFVSLYLFGFALMYFFFKFQKEIERISLKSDTRISNLEMECYSKEAFLVKLVNAGDELISELECDALIKKIRDVFSFVTQASVGYLLMYNQNRNIYEWTIGHNLSSLKLKAGDINSEDLLIRKIVSNNDNILFHDIEELIASDMLHIRLDALHKIQPKPEIIMTIRLKMKQSLLGVKFLFLTKMQLYDIEINLKIFKGLVNMATLALGSAVQREFAINDRMTMMYNHEYFISRLREEILASRRSKDRKLAMLMIDIDHFKKFNDTYGHQIGDFVLIETSNVYKECVRMSDVVARYGGEEFAIILPQTTLEDAIKVAEKIRAAVEDHIYNTDKGELHVTISIGVCEWTADINPPLDDKMMIKIADTKLYEAKEGGRNMVCY